MGDLLITSAPAWERAVSRGAQRLHDVRSIDRQADMITAHVRGTTAGADYQVTVTADRDGQHASCTCQAGTHGLACWHVGAVLALIARAMPEPSTRRCVGCGRPLTDERGTRCGRCALRLLNGDD